MLQEMDREPQPGDGPEYHAEHAAWLRRQSPAVVRDAEISALTEKLEVYSGVLDEIRKRHTYMPRPSIISCTCGKLICEDLNILTRAGLAMVKNA